ncbi:MAG: glycosyltransferase family 39 protein, partial [Pirellulaceae bacterium]|nr:glycosyltransferase family 39 protein [Pirellulaceae bacterium]
MSTESEKTDLIHRIPVWVRICAVLAYFLLFSLAESHTPNSTPEAAAVGSPADEGGQRVAAHHVPWIRLIVPDLMVAEWFESDSNRIGILDRIPILGGALLLLAAVLLLGHSLLRLLRIEPTNTLESSVFSFALGMSAVSLYVLLIGLAGGLRIKTLYVVPVILALVYEVYHYRPLTSVRAKAQQFVARLKPTRQAWLILLPFGLIVAGAILPPWEFDVREYHMQVPAEWYRTGQIEYLPHNVYGNMPLASELILIPPMALGSGPDSWYSGALIGKTMMSFYVIFAALAVMAIARRFGQQRSGWAAAILLVSCPWIGYVATTGLNEVALGCFIVTSVLAILNAQNSQNPLWYVLLAGVFAGSAAATKYTGVVFAILPLLVWTMWIAKTRGTAVEISPANKAHDKRSSWNPVWTYAVVFTIGATIVFSPWLIK